VTGAARGIGRSIATRLAADGYDVCINDVPGNQGGIDEVVSLCKHIGGVKAVGFAADVSDYDQVERMVETSVKELGPLNTMIANAGIAQVKPLLDLTAEDFHHMFSINVYGVHNCYKAAAKQMIAQGNAERDHPGKILGAASIVAHKPFPLLSHYSASKWAVRGLTQAYALEMAEHNITVNCYCPGIVGTAMWDLIDEHMGKLRGEKLGTVVKKGEVIKELSEATIALGRVSVPEDVAKTVSFLASRDSDYMTGQSIVIDGGIIMT